jgi:hypothetical protein
MALGMGGLPATATEPSTSYGVMSGHRARAAAMAAVAAQFNLEFHLFCSFPDEGEI